MKLKRRGLIVLVMIVSIVFGIVQNMSYATSGTLGLKLSYKRYTSSDGWAYALNNGTAHPIYQIISVNGDNIVGTNYYCLDADTSATWNYSTDSTGKYDTASIGKTANYTDYYDMEKKADLSEINNFSNKVAVNKYYNQIMWILDNMYLYSSSEEKNETTGNSLAVEEMMAKAGIVYGDTGATKGGKAVYSYYGDEDNNTYYAKYKANTLYGNRDANGGYFYTNASGEQVNVLLSSEQVEAVEQAAIWYFTNYLGNNKSKYNMYTEVNSESGTAKFGDSGWLKYTSGTETNSYNWPLLNSIATNNENEGKMLQEQASILYNYLIDGANDHKDNYKPSSNPLSLEAVKVETEKVGTNKIYGKFKINKDAENTTTYKLDDKVQILDGSGNEVEEAKIVDSTGKEINKTAGELVGTEFYVSVPASSNVNKITVKVTGKYDTTEKLLWISSEKTEQPIVEIEKKTKPIELTASLEEEKIFDLALRKAIIGVSTKAGASKSVINEEGNDATRSITYDVAILQSGTTATYKHRKDPIVVEEGNIVKYSITVYNEGGKKGYAEEIVDQLPAGLALKGYTANKTKTGTYTSADGKTKYTYVYDPSTNKITFTNVTKNELEAYGGNAELDSEKIEIECEVTKKTSNTEYTYLTNIAYISKEYDSEASKEIITEKGLDRDSEPGTYPTKTAEELVTSSKEKDGYPGYKGDSNYKVYDDTKNSMYFKGQQDDDDFEIIVMLPKEFDLKLVKYITAVNGDKEKGRTVTKIDTTDLASGKETTAEYTLDKEPVKVKYGDYVTYTFRVYNEGDVDGYVTKLTDNIPLGLQFVQAKGDGKTVTIYSYDNEKKELTSKDEQVDSTTYKLIDENNAYWSIDKETTTTGNSLKTDTYDGDTTPSISINVKDYLGGTNKLLNAYDSSKDNNNDGSGLTYVDVTAVLRVSESAKIDKIIRNEAAITGDSDADGNDVTDRDSQPENWPGKDDHDKYQDDEDFDRIIVQRFDLALRKQIIRINEKNYTDRFANLASGQKNTLYDYYDVDSNIPRVEANDIVTYSIRVYNEGDLDGTATWVTDEMPTGLEYLENDSTNINNGWRAYKEISSNEDGAIKIGEKYCKQVDFTSNEISFYATQKLSGETIKAYTGTGEADYKEVYMVARVKAKSELATGITYKLRNYAEIGDDNGEDEDSTPGNDSKWKDEDDRDIEDLKLLEYKDIPVQKVWEDNNNQDGVRPEKIILILKKENIELSRVDVVPDSNGDWKYTFKHLLKYDDDDKEINYTVEEENVDKYDTTYVKKEDESYIITNKHIPEEISIPVQKIWDDSNNKYGIRPESITLNLYADNELVKTVKVMPDSNGDWKYTFTNLPKYNNAKTIKYDVKEDEVKGYQTIYDSYEITNKLIEGQYDLNIVKTDKKGNIIKDLVTGFSINEGKEQKTVDGVLEFGTTEIKEVEKKDIYLIKEITPPDSYSKFDGTIKIEVAKELKDNKYQIDISNTIITVYDKDGNILANGVQESNNIGIYMTVTTTKVEVKVEDERVDLSLRKFIVAVSKDNKIDEGEYITEDGTSKTPYIREPILDTSKLKTGEENTAIYKHTKNAIEVSINDYVLYTIRVYNEGEANTYASKITDYLPTYLDYIECKFNDSFGWKVGEDGKTITTEYLSKENETSSGEKILKAFDNNLDDGKGSGISYRDVQILVRVNNKAPINKNLTNIAEISEYEDKNGDKLKEDRDSKSGNFPKEKLSQDVRPDYNGGEDKDKTDEYIPGQEDDDDFERIVVIKFDLALRKQIVQIHNTYANTNTKYTDRYAKLKKDQEEDGNTIYDYYDVESNKPQVVENDLVLYSIRVYNEGKEDGTATWVTDKMPTGLEYVKENDVNKKYGWKAYKEVKEEEEGAIKIGEKYYKEVDYSSKEITLYATEYLKGETIKAYTGTGEADYKEVYVVARVRAKKEVTEGEYKLLNTAEIGDDNGDDEDSTPGNDNEWQKEDDLDIEDLQLVEFDLSLLKYVSTVYVTEDGKTTTTQTNNVGNDNTDIIPKVEINRKKINKTTVKFGYTIKITNEGDIAGYAKEITDYVPEGLKFYAEDNQGWTDEGNNVISTRLLENTLLQPGESAQVTVILRWINGSDNLGVKVNTAEISEDYNDKHVPDRDSTPDNRVPGEDDIDDAPVLLSISTGLGKNIMMFVGIGIVILGVLGTGIVLIKKYVL